MKLVQINTLFGSGSTGKICLAVSNLLDEEGIENYTLYASGHSDSPKGKRYMTGKEVKLQALKSRIFGNYGMNSTAATKRILAELDRICPDIIHLHNLHGHNCDLRLLFSYIRRKGIRVFWTFHDCWAFTGYCPHYDMVGCDKWKTGCKSCIQRKRYSWFFDRSAALYEKKKTLLQDLDITVITPSRWMADQVKESFLKDYPVKVIHNGIDLSVFRPRESDFRKTYGIGDKFLLLGVSFEWGQRKGLDVFLRLAETLDERFQIVLVGTNENIDKTLPKNIISIHRTNDQQALAEIYTAADLLLNPTREENFPTVHLESLACGTPILSFNTGGCKETFDESCGTHVPKDDFGAFLSAILRIEATKPYSSEACTTYATRFDQGNSFRSYVSLYSPK